MKNFSLFSLQIKNIVLLLHRQNKAIGLWCNGNTTDSGPVILGSNPGSPTKTIFFGRSFFLFYVCAGWCRHCVPLMSNPPMHQCKHCARLLLHHSKAAHQPPHPSSYKFFVSCYLILTARWLSRYDSYLLLRLRPALFYGIGSMLRIQILVAQLKRPSSEGRFLFLSLLWQEGSRAD